MELLAEVNSEIVSTVVRILQRHAAQVRALRDEEVASNARAELLESLTARLLRGELPSCLHASPLAAPQPEGENRREKKGQEEEWVDAPSALPLVALHDSDSMAQAERSLLTASEELSQSSSPVGSPREDEDEGRSCATPSPTRRELEEFFPITAAKRSRQACIAEESCRRRRCMEVHNNSAGGEDVITATDILAAIPCLSSNIALPATHVGAVECEEKPRGCVRSYNRRQLDYAADAARYARAGEAAQDGCTPSVYWEIAFPRDPNGNAFTDGEQRG
ncbi:hypothetical protein TraAM80_00367 [Trypanosoma rangeli]|uniref:Uncharacterized protein n=1 Tax=Trypanosoma rangeli TaxID=5698 RepID=A0A3R7KYS7_TRYRA|nr:uncharacterized protein TraAM80_00367 [Trypanosoma rangeli]RNF12356.1 hypothetical protein TraAM80_00367 [Trypanosoma rangeli]|eukprot:RNF12356.1 hypothetical protein TraAM80_00367 [Trypanosoma rangeli]